MDKDDFLTCLVCLEIANDAVESECCNCIYCKKCAEGIRASRNSSCAKCRAGSFKWRDSVLARRMISSMPCECPNCKQGTTLGDLNTHLLVCPAAMRKCHVSKCTFNATTDEFLVHLMKDHKKDILTAFDENSTRGSPNEKPIVNAPFSDPIITRTNEKGLKARLGSSGKYYCGGKLEGKCGPWGCCDGSCGPTNGCNCRACMILDIQTRNLPKGYWVNRDGAICRRGTTGNVYCGRKMDMPGSDGYCGPTNGPQCKSCKVLQGQLAERYEGVNC